MRCWPAPAKPEGAKELPGLMPAKRGEMLALLPTGYRGDGMNRLLKGVLKLYCGGAVIP